jgi:hypothetical protein
VLIPAFWKVIEQLPAPDDRVPVQDSPVLAFTVTDPVGPAPVPLTEKLMATACWREEGLGESEVMAAVLPALDADVNCVIGEGDVYLISPAQVADSVHVPVPLIIVTRALAFAGVPLTVPTVHTPVVPVICGMVLAFVVALTVKLVLYAALAGAPVNVTVGVSRLTARLAVPITVPDAAVIVAEPEPTPVARPAEFIVATEMFDDDQFTEFVTVPVVPSV